MPKGGPGLPRRRRYAPDATCEVAGCDRRPQTRGLCDMHYQRLRAHGTTADRPKRVYVRSYRPRLTPKGYLITYDPDHPNSSRSGFVMEHIRVVTESLGRPLAKGETVHHKNGVRDDNRPENLELRVGAHFQGLSPDEAVTWAREILARYT